MPAVRRLGRPRETDLRAIVDAILYIARTGCQWRSYGMPPRGKRQARTAMRRGVKATRRNRGAAMSVPPTVAVFGGTGFLGHNIVAHLRAKGLAVRVVARHPGHAERMFGEPRPELSYQAGDLLYEKSTAAAIEGTYMVVNAVSLYAERDGITFEAVHVKGARRVARLSARHGAERFV